MMHRMIDTHRRIAARRRGARQMDVILHIGAHRTATTSFQHYMRLNGPALQRRRVGFWGPLRTRGALLAGVLPATDEVVDPKARDTARRRIETALRRAEAAGLRHLVVSEENLPGTPAHNMRQSQLYPDVGARIARVSDIFGHRISRVVMTLRPQPGYWPSALACAVERGHPLPARAQLDRIARGPRLWQDVVRDLASHQGAPIVLLRHRTAPDDMLTAMTAGAVAAPQDHTDHWLNAAPDRAELRAALDARGARACAIPAGEGAWQPFTPDQRALLAEAWQDDEFWLAAGAGGLATYLPTGRSGLRKTEQSERAGQHLPPGRHQRGQAHGIEKRRMVGHR